jgi:hypothetical protein
VAASDEETIGDIDGIGTERAPGILTAARERVEQVRVEAAAEAAAQAAAAEGASGAPAGEEEAG